MLQQASAAMALSTALKQVLHGCSAAIWAHVVIPCCLNTCSIRPPCRPVNSYNARVLTKMWAAGGAVSAAVEQEASSGSAVALPAPSSHPKPLLPPQVCSCLNRRVYDWQRHKVPVLCAQMHSMQTADVPPVLMLVAVERVVMLLKHSRVLLHSCRCPLVQVLIPIKAVLHFEGGLSCSGICWSPKCLSPLHSCSLAPQM